MKNKEKYANEIIELAIHPNGGKIAVNKNTGEPVACVGFDCYKCLLYGDCEEYTRNSEGLAKWAEAEYRESTTAERIHKEFKQMCEDTSCYECEYHGETGENCYETWLLKHYNVTEKSAEND